MTFNLLDILLNPKTCVVCGSIGTNLCDKCQKLLPVSDLDLCLICDKPTVDGKIHKFCIQDTLLYTYPEAYFSPFLYEGLSKKLITKAKYDKFQLKLLDPLISHPSSVRRLKSLEKKVYVVPVPMTKKLFNKRKVNQTLYISGKIAEILDTKVLDILSKNQGVHSQRGLSKELRILNLKGKITLSTTSRKLVHGHDVLLVDDVATTGATLLECTKVLKQSGANKVFCYTLAKDLRYN